MKKIIILILIFNFVFQHAFWAVVNYNVADFKSDSFNDWAPINTWNKAWITVEKEVTYSWTIQISDSVYNIADFKSESFNNWLPLNTWKKAKVSVDKTLDTSSSWSSTNITSDISYNIADFKTESFNNWFPVNTWKRAKVSVDKSFLTVNSWTYIYWDKYYNIASFLTESFNNWLPVDTWKKAQVLVAKVTYNSWNLVVDKDSNYNLASFQSDSFNNWLPITTGRKARVIFEKNEQFYEDHQISQTQSWEITYTNFDTTTTNSWYIKDYSNSLKYIFQSIYKTNKNINLQDITGNIYNKKWSSNTIVVWDKWLVQEVIQKNPANNEKLSYTKNNNFIIWDWEIYKSETTLLSVTLTWAIVVPPVLTYPYKEIIWSWSSATEKYMLRTNYPIIKWMAYPNSIMEVLIWSNTYYVKVDNNWLFQFNPSKKISDWNVSISFQYLMLDDWLYSKLTNLKLQSPKVYNITVDWASSYDFPYITSIYNDDYMYTDLFYMEWFANTWSLLNYKLTKLDWTLVTSWTTNVNPLNKKFSFILWDSTIKLDKWDYIIDVWQWSWYHERKSFTLIWNSQDSIWILNINDYEILPTLQPTFMWYSKESIINKDTVRVYACDITNGLSITTCNESNKIFIWTINSDKNGFFSFTPLEPLKNNSYYEIDFVNTQNTNLHKKVVIKTEIWNIDTIFNSQVTNIKSWLNVWANTISVEWYTLPNTNVVMWTNSFYSNSNWRFIKEIPFTTDLNIKFLTWWTNFELNYNIIKSNSNINNTSTNYFQYFKSYDKKIIDYKE